MTVASNPLPDPARLEAVLRTAVDAIVIINERGIVELFNAAAERMFGYSAAEIIGRNISMLMPAPHSEQHDSYLASYLETHQPKIIGIGRELVARRRDGSEFPIDLAVSETLTNGKHYFTGVIHDITARKQTLEALRTERDFIAAVLATTGGLVFVFDAERHIIRFNRACEELSGYREAEVLGRRIEDLFLLTDEIPSMVQVTEQLLADRIPTKHEHSWVSRSGHRHLISWSMSVLQVGGKNDIFVIGTGIDITQERLSQLYSAQQEKLAAVGQLAAGVAHEIGNPLSSISAVVQTVMRKSQDPFVREKLDLVGSQIHRIGATLRQMMDFARPPRLKWSSCSIPEVLERSLELIRFDRRARDVEVHVNAAKDLPTTFAVPDLLAQVFINLMLNAFDAMQTNPPERRRLLVIESLLQTTSTGPHICVRFRDSGPGISPDVVGRVLEPFFTTKGAGKGTGLGLSVSYRIIKDHGGKLHVEGGWGQGACITVDLPVLTEPRTTLHAVDEPSE
ncbi:MAG: PAS domain S-box protein [Planctomycetota bacterium]